MRMGLGGLLYYTYWGFGSKKKAGSGQKFSIQVERGL